MQHLCLTLPFFFFGKSVPGNWSQWIHVTVYTQRPQRPSAREDNPSRVSQELSPREAQLLRRVIWSCPQPCLLTATTHRAVCCRLCLCGARELSRVCSWGRLAGQENHVFHRSAISGPIPSGISYLCIPVTFLFSALP